MYFSANADTLMQGIPNFIITLTPDESEIAAGIRTQLNTHLSESLILFVTGDVEINDANWAAFVDTLKNLGAEQLLDIYNGKLDTVEKW